MVKSITPEIFVVLLVGFLLTVIGIYLNFQNLDNVMYRTATPADYATVKSNEAIYGLLQVMGIAIIFVGASRGVLRRSDIMANKFVNIMDVFTSLIKRELDVMKDREVKKTLAEMEVKTEQFKSEMRGLRRL